MQIKADALEGALKRRALPLVWIHGDEPLLQLEAVDLVRRHIRQQGFNERQVFPIERGFKTDEVDAHANALSLFADKLLIELRWAGKPIKEQGLWLSNLVGRLPDSVRILASSARLDRNSTESDWFASLDPHALIVPVYPIERAQLPAWIGRRLAAQGQSADEATLSLISDRVEGNLLAAQQEIHKLSLLLPAGRLADDQVRAAVFSVARYDASDLTEAIILGDLPRALRSLHGLHAEGEAEPLVLWALADAIRSLGRVAKTVRAGSNPAQAIRQARVFAPRDRLFEQALRRQNLDALIVRCERALRAAAATDRIIKGVDSGDPWQAFESVVLIMAAASVPAQVGLPA